jgi:DNA (cytosine-5)-methyltransferase 1
MTGDLFDVDGAEKWRQTGANMADPTEHRFNLRLNAEAFSTIDRMRHEGIGKISRNSWLAEAVAEKIERDGVRNTHLNRIEGRAGRRYFEFFAGGGMARAGLGDGWDCVFSNDFDPMKARVYRDNWHGGPELLVEDVNKVRATDLPGEADLVWASFPCQDLSLAGNYGGIGQPGLKHQTRSGAFWPFWNLVRALKDERRAPKIIVLENVLGILTSNAGRDFSAICSEFSDANYRFGAMVINARHFVPQSRPRVFIVALRDDVEIPERLISANPIALWHPDRLQRTQLLLSKEARKRWIWWNLPKPSPRKVNFVDLIEDTPVGVDWHTPSETRRLIAMMSDVNLEKLAEAQRSKERVVGAVYKRTRLDANGKKIQRAEVRFDDIAGCLRTPAGGSSRQIILLVQGKHVRSRLLSPREAARLMGLPDTFKLPTNYNDAYHVAGDGVVVPAVRHLAEFIFEPILGVPGTNEPVPTKYIGSS